MSEENDQDGLQDPPRDRKAYQDLGSQIQELLVKGSFIPASGGPKTGASDLGRLVVAFTALPDERVRSALLSLMETVASE